MKFLVLQQLLLVFGIWLNTTSASADARIPFFVLAGVWQVLLIVGFVGHICRAAHRPRP